MTDDRAEDSARLSPLLMQGIQPRLENGQIFESFWLARTIHQDLLRRPILSPGGFSLERLATASMNNPG